MKRRKFIQLGSWVVPLAGILPAEALELIDNRERNALGEIEKNPLPKGDADYTLRIGEVLANLAPDRVLSTTGYNGEVSGQVIRFQEGKRITVDIYNDTDTPEQVH